MVGNKKVFAERMDGNLKYKKLLIDFIPKRSTKILDFGCGTGALTREIREAFPDAEVHALDSDIEMLEEAMSRDAANKYLLSLDHAQYHSYDAIILSSVIHEVENIEFFLGVISWYVRGDGVILVRDGVADESNPEVRYSLREPLIAQAFFKECGDSLIGNLDIRFEADEIVGKTNDVRNFLQTYTWGFESLEREKNEKFIRLPPKQYKELGKVIRARDYVWEITQSEYFDHLDKLVVLEGQTWPTHAIVVYRKGGK